MRFFIRTFGCQMNVHDSRRIEEILTAAGHEPVPDATRAELLLVNSCTIREKPWHKAISETGRFRKRKSRDRSLLVGLVGCVAQQEGDRVFKLLDGVDFVISPDNYQQLPSVIAHLQEQGKPACITGFDGGEAEAFLGVQDVRTHEVSTFVTITKGCDERCHYCIVPSVRGPERHRDADRIVEEVRGLVDHGVREVTLLGQKVNAYAAGGVDFAELLRRLDDVDGLLRLRFTSPHPRHMTDDVIGLFGQLRTLCPAIHLPLQAGSDAVLAAMGRRYTRADYLRVVDKLRERVADMSISTDLIVGFPGETPQDFEQTLSLIGEVGFSSAFSFMYSPRPGTAAWELTDDVPPAEKERRLAAAHVVIDAGERRFRETLSGTRQDVLVEGKGRMPGQLTGRAGNFQIVNFYCDRPFEAMCGSLVPVVVTRLPHMASKGRSQ